DVHLAAARALASGLVELGVLRGDPDELVADGVHALFFPHGVGHLIGLDVHDMEDLGDRAGYAPGRSRSEQFGLAYLRLDRDLEAGMAVTIEPGFYQVPAILEDEARVSVAGDRLNRDALARFHVRRPDGALVDGAAAFVEIWARVSGFGWMARLSRLPGAMPVLEAGYRVFLKLRPKLTGRDPDAVVCRRTTADAP
ncbi:MAG: M24 family metallopeptidase, partial [Azospirillaceae bacterium]